MADLGVFEAMANAGKLSAEAAAKSGSELEKSIDRAIFRAKERFGAYLAGAESKPDLENRWTQVKPEVIKIIAQVTTPTPGVIQRVGRALDPSLSSRAAAKKNRPSSAKVAEDKAEQKTASAPAPDSKLVSVSATKKLAWAYDQGTKLWTSKDPMQKFACPGCGTEQEHLGLSHCAGCDRTWNSWPVRQASSGKTSASTYVLMARELKMRGDQFKMAAAGNVKIASDSGAPWIPDPAERAQFNSDLKKAALADAALLKAADAPMPQEPPPGMSQPSFGTMPGDNSGAMGAPVPPEQPPTPGGDQDNDGDVAGGVTENSPIDQIQDALQDAIVSLKDVQMLSINPALSTMASTKTKKIAALKDAMDRFWALHKELNYIAGMLKKEANEAIRAADPRITREAEFVKGFRAAESNLPLPERTGREWLQGYIAFHRQADSYDTGVDTGRTSVPGGDDESEGARNEGSYLGDSGLDDATADTSDAGPFDTSQPASQAFVSQMDTDNAAGDADHGQGQSGSIQPTGARRQKSK